jgi:prepilin-type N-terminal cleavage/methylation domain-containing protein
MRRISQNGFTLIESVVVVSIIGITVALAMPNYQQWIAKDDLKAGIVDFKGALQIARVTALATGAPVGVVNTASNKYSVFVDDGIDRIVLGVSNPAFARNGVLNNEVIIKMQGQDETTFNTGVTFVLTPVAIEFLSSGRRSLPTGVGNLVITLQNGFGLTRTVTVSALGDIM